MPSKKSMRDANSEQDPDNIDVPFERTTAMTTYDRTQTRTTSTTTTAVGSYKGNRNKYASPKSSSGAMVPYQPREYHDDDDEVPQPMYKQRGVDDAEQPQPEQPRRQFKYSTANMRQHSPWRRYCCICLLFVLALLFIIGLSILMNKLFFDQDKEDQQDTFADRANDTFPHDKMYVDQTCSTGTFNTDQGVRCRETCEPQFFECCDPFHEFQAYNYTTYNSLTNSTLPPEFAPDDDTVKGLARNKTCSFEYETRGCMSYAKCQAIGGVIDPAPGTLPILCSPDVLAQDPGGCQEICLNVRCCYEAENNCLADKFDICMDYAPCQNLRPGVIIATAPDDLDQACFYETPECFEICEGAACCGDANSTCFKDNFMSCLTYAACFNVTDTNITVAPQFNTVPMPPVELIYACDEHDEAVLQPTNKTCEEYCEAAQCCYNADPATSCFHADPLGCMTWNQQCQVLYPTPS